MDSLKINEHVGYVQYLKMTLRLDSKDRGIGLNTMKRRVPKFWNWGWCENVKEWAYHIC